MHIKLCRAAMLDVCLPPKPGRGSQTWWPGKGRAKLLSIDGLEAEEPSTSC
jgi:hypothetical protein